MKHLVCAVAGLCLLGSGVAIAAPQAAKTVRGAVTAVGPDSVTVMVKDQSMKFVIDTTTEVIAPGAGTQARAAKAEGKPGASVASIVKAGQTVEVKYHEAAMHAASIRVLSSTSASATAPSAEKPKAAAAEKPKEASTSGTVTALTGSSLTVSTSAGQSTFAVDNTTRVVGIGMGTKARQDAVLDKKPVLADLIGVGDTVMVSYHDMSGVKHAAEVHLTKKAAK